LIIVAAPAQKAVAQNGDVAAEWEMVDTPTMEGWVLAPQSLIVDYHTAAEGEVAYAVVDAYDEDCDGDMWVDHYWRLLKSDDYCATWDDLTDALEDLMDVDGGDYIDEIMRVATDWEDPDFVAVALWWWDNTASDYFLHVFFSTDGGDTFEDAGEVEDGGVFLQIVADLVVTPESGGDRDIFIGGTANSTYGAGLFHCVVTGDSAGAWHDATDFGDYEGWDNMDPGDDPPLDVGDIMSWLVTDIIVSPNWGLDNTVLVTTIAWDWDTTFQGVYLQCGSFGSSPAWNGFSTLGIEAVEIKTNNSHDILLPTEFMMFDARAIAGLLLPEDYNSKNADDRVLWVWVNYWDWSTGENLCDIMRVEDDSADPVGPMGQIEDGELWLTNISYHGTIAEGEAIAGVLGNGGYYYMDGSPDDLFTECCEGVQVYRNDGIRNMDICCERWHDACKPPTGEYAMAVTYVGDDKAYAVALGGFYDYDEGAWSVTFDDGDTWNQLSLIDTNIDYLSDVEVSPDCNKTFLVSVNVEMGCGCDSVWLHAVNLPEAEEYSGQWLRTWCGQLEGWWHEDDHGGMLRLNPEETNGDTVVLYDYGTSNVYINYLETLACWDPISSTELDEIVDLAMLDIDTIFALDYNGDVSMFDDDEWQEAVDSELDDEGWSIAVHGDYVLVGGWFNGEVSISDDGGETFTRVEETTDIEGHVTVAFDSYFDQNSAIYAAIEGWTYDYNGWGYYAREGGIYLWILGESVDWTDIGACNEYAYTGIVLDTADGNPMTSPETGGVLYASFIHENEYYSEYGTGVARTLMPIVEICCDIGDTEWDYLIESEPDDWVWDDSWFSATPHALEICGCLTPDTNTHLFVIDSGSYYDMCEHEWGQVWTFEDCYSKKGVELSSPADGFVVGVDVCDCCNVPFTIMWDRLCDACCYEFEFALDEDFTQMVDVWECMHDDEKNGNGGPNGGECCPWCCYGYCPDNPTEPSWWVGCCFNPETTYYWRVRAVEAETYQCIKSWWSEPRSFTVAPTAEAGAINLVSPEPGATDASIDGLGFSWIMLAQADNFDWVLDNNSDFSSPVDSETGLTDTAYGTTATLDYDTTYYWQVTAYRDGSEIGKSAVGTFRTMMEAEPEPEPEPDVTPFWVWVVIAIGAVLVIVVIVLIFRTRRV
jgi:hypothetical protein